MKSDSILSYHSYEVKPSQHGIQVGCNISCLQDEGSVLFLFFFDCRGTWKGYSSRCEQYNDKYYDLNIPKGA